MRFIDKYISEKSIDIHAAIAGRMIAAGTGLRKTMQEIKRIAQKIRNDLTEQKNA